MVGSIFGVATGQQQPAHEGFDRFERRIARDLGTSPETVRRGLEILKAESADGIVRGDAVVKLRELADRNKPKTAPKTVQHRWGFFKRHIN